MSSFGENYKKNDLLDDIQHYFSEGGTIEEMFDVLRYIFEYGKTPLDDLIQENQKLKKQLENCYCNRTDCSSRIKDSKQYDSLVQKIENQQKEFIEYLNWQIKNCMDTYKKYGPDNINIDYAAAFEVALDKYKEIIGGYNE